MIVLVIFDLDTRPGEALRCIQVFPRRRRRKVGVRAYFSTNRQKQRVFLPRGGKLGAADRRRVAAELHHKPADDIKRQIA